MGTVNRLFGKPDIKLYVMWTLDKMTSMPVTKLIKSWSSVSPNAHRTG